MAEYIDREKYCEETCRCDKNYCDKARCSIWIAKAEDVAPVVHGRWIDSGVRDDDGNGEYTCSRCDHNDRHSPSIIVPHCWFCGAKMDLKQEGPTNGKQHDA